MISQPWERSLEVLWPARAWGCWPTLTKHAAFRLENYFIKHSFSPRNSTLSSWSWCRNINRALAGKWCWNLSTASGALGCVHLSSCTNKFEFSRVNIYKKASVELGNKPTFPFTLYSLPYKIFNTCVYNLMLIRFQSRCVRKRNWHVRLGLWRKQIRAAFSQGLSNCTPHLHIRAS